MEFFNRRKASRIRNVATRTLGSETLEQRRVLSANALSISEIHFDPTFGDLAQDQYFEIKGAPAATIPQGTYFVVVEGNVDQEQNPGQINSVFDLSGLQFGLNGYLNVFQGGASYPVDQNSASIQGTVGFAGLPGDRFSDNELITDRFESIFDSGTFMLVQSNSAPQPDVDVDANDDGVLDVPWTVHDAVSVFGAHLGGSPDDVSYADIIFRSGGNQAPGLNGQALVDLDTVSYVARLSESGNDASDWMGGETREKTSEAFDFEVFARNGNEAYRKFVGRALDHIGSANFFASISGTLFHDENGNGTRDAGELGKPGDIFLDQNSDGILNSYQTFADPDEHLEDTVLTHAFPGVTLTTADDNNGILTFPIVAEDSADATTGSLIFSQGTRRLMMDFTNPVSSVSIDFAAVASSGRGILEAFDQDGNLLDADLSELLTDTPETMTVSDVGANIAFAVAYADASVSPFGALDNLRFTQPERSTTTDSSGNYSFGSIVPQIEELFAVRALTDDNEAVTSPPSGHHNLLVPFAFNFAGLDLGVDSRQPYDIVGRANTGAWWEASSDGTTFTNEYQTNWSTAVAWEDVFQGKFRGNLSEIVGRNGAELWVSENHGDNVIPRFWGNLPHADNWVDVMVGDFNGDRRSDWVGRRNGEWWIGASQPSDSFAIQRWGIWSDAVTWEDVLLGDFNGDGRDDIIGRTNGDWWVAVSTDDSRFQNHHWGQWSTQAQWEDVMVGDFNGDGLDDITGRANGDWWVSLSDGSAFITEFWGRWSSTAVWQDVMVSDFNGDGMDDIGGRTNGDWWIAQSVDHFFSTSRWASWSNTAEWLDVRSADFNGDGLDDIAGRANGGWWVAESNGQQFATRQWTRWSTNVDWVDIQVGQFGNGGQTASGSSAVIDIEVAGVPGDANRNGKVGFEDFLIVSGNFGDEVEVGQNGDVDGDGTVAFNDFLLVSANFGF